jgi:hypothetical protein
MLVIEFNAKVASGDFRFFFSDLAYITEYANRIAPRGNFQEEG